MFERSIHRKRSFFVSSKFVNWLHGIFVLFFLSMLSLFLRPSITNIRMHTSKMLRTYTNIYVRFPFMLNLCSSKTFSWTFALIWSQQRWWVDLAFGHPLLHLAYFISFGSVRFVCSFIFPTRCDYHKCAIWKCTSALGVVNTIYEVEWRWALNKFHE